MPLADTIDIFCQEKIRLERLGKKLEDYDLFIGCAAKARGLVMVTDGICTSTTYRGISSISRYLVYAYYLYSVISVYKDIQSISV